MTSFFSLDAAQLAVVCHGRWLSAPPDCMLDCFLDDSRAIKTGAVFFAIDGRRYGLPGNGMDYLANAAEAGAAAAVVESCPAEGFPAGLPCLLVENALDAFQAVARASRMFRAVPVVGITGSCGKTSTKEMIAAVLEQKFPGGVLKTEGNTNNYFGVPRNLLRRKEQTNAMVIEMGTNHVGEIRKLAEIVQPDIAVICSIGAAHLEAFHNELGVCEEKGDLFSASRSDAICIFPKDCSYDWVLCHHATLGTSGTRRLLSFGYAPASDIQVHYLGMEEDGYHVRFQDHRTGDQATLVWNIGGESQASNAAAACAVGMAFGMNLRQCVRGLQNVVLPGTRMAESSEGGMHWFNDAYNANPTSMLAGLRWFREVSADAPARALLLGDMRELGVDSPRFHRDALQQARELFPADRIFSVGPLFAEASFSLGIPHAENIEELSALISSLPRGTWIFLKASHGVQLYAMPSLFAKK